MKKIMILLQAAAVLTACTSKVNHNGDYVSRIIGAYSLAEETLKIHNVLIINRTEYQKIRQNGKLLPKQYKMRRWTLNGADAPVMHFTGDQVISGETIYQKLL